MTKTLSISSINAPPVQVKHRYTEQVMVMKEMRHASKEAKLSFLKEVRFPCMLLFMLTRAL